MLIWNELSGSVCTFPPLSPEALGSNPKPTNFFHNLIDFLIQYYYLSFEFVIEIEQKFENKRN